MAPIMGWKMFRRRRIKTRNQAAWKLHQMETTMGRSETTPLHPRCLRETHWTPAAMIINLNRYVSVLYVIDGKCTSYIIWWANIQYLTSLQNKLSWKKSNVKRNNFETNICFNSKWSKAFYLLFQQCIETNDLYLGYQTSDSASSSLCLACVASVK